MTHETCGVAEVKVRPKSITRYNGVANGTQE